jgi:hypothetical protein
MRRWVMFVLAAALALPLFATPAARAEVEVDEPLYVPAMLIREGNFRADPSTKNPPIGTYPAGHQVLILGSKADSQQRLWYLIRLYETGEEGWMFGNLLRALPAFPSSPIPVTQVDDAAEKALLVGGHGLTLQWIGLKEQGELVAFEDLGLIYLQGTQNGSGKTEGDWIQVRGFVSLVETNRFVLQGTIEYRVASLTGQNTCRREGVFVFQRAAKKKNWRLETTASPCGKWDQYVDVYVRDEN